MNCRLVPVQFELLGPKNLKHAAVETEPVPARFMLLTLSAYNHLLCFRACFQADTVKEL
jgi:hypothetical protein